MPQAYQNRGGLGLVDGRVWADAETRREPDISTTQSQEDQCRQIRRAGSGRAPRGSTQARPRTL
jgi:hypothetical protein